jgi:hypothetical protein
VVFRVLAVTVPYALLILKLGKDRIGTSSEQHHAHEEWDDCLDRHVEGLACLRAGRSEGSLQRSRSRRRELKLPDDHSLSRR